MAEIVDDFMDGIDDFVDETPRSDDPNVLRLSMEDYSALSPDHNIELTEKQKGKRPRGLDENYEDPIGDGEILFKRPRMEGCPNPVPWIEKKVEDPSIFNPSVRDHLAECIRLSKDMTKWLSMDENDLKSQMFLSLFKVNDL